MTIPEVTNKNSNTLQEKWIKSHYPEFYDFIIENYPINIQFKEKLYWYFNGITNHPVCETCGATVKFISFGEGYKRFCSGACSSRNESTQQKTKQTNLERYGTDNPAKSQQIKDKIKQINEEKYGCHPMRLESTHEKIKQNCRKKYGVDHFAQLDGTKQKIKQTKLEKYGDENYNGHEKAVKTNLEKYGVDNPQKSPEIHEKTKQTNLEKYGAESPLQSPKICEKIKQTNLERYGAEYIGASKVIRERIRTSMLEHWNVEYPLQSPEIQEKIKKTNLERYGKESYSQTEQFKNQITKANKNTMKLRLPELIDILTTNSGILYQIKCPHPDCSKCNERYFETPPMLYYDRKQNFSEPCTRILPVENGHNSGTTIELFVRDILDRNNIKYETNNRKVLSGKELDIYIPDHKIAIECNGIYWHSLKEPKYHFNKWNQCKEQGIQLLTIWEDQIINKPEIIRNIILSKLDIYEHSIGARECTIKETSNSEAQEFLSMYHLQGPVSGSVRLGLYHNDELVSLMVFGRKRTALGNKKHDTWELYRYCTKAGWTVTGGAQKLLSHFIKSHPGTILESFSSNDISIGTLYKKLGFELDSIQSGSYWYIDKEMNRHHRYSFRKDILVKNGADPNLTEFEITDEMGLFRIYDSGQQKWILNINS